MARRFVRLWPVYALCLACGHLIAGIQPAWLQFLWYPLTTADTLPKIDPPIWSLGIEAYAMPLMPLIVWAGGRHLLPLSYTNVRAFNDRVFLSWRRFWTISDRAQHVCSRLLPLPMEFP